MKCISDLTSEYNKLDKRKNSITEYILEKSRELLFLKEKNYYQWCRWGSIDTFNAKEIKVSFSDHDGFSVVISYPTHLIDMPTGKFSGKELKQIDVKNY